MTNIEYGPEIRVDGKRPEWLRDDEDVWFVNSLYQQDTRRVHTIAFSSNWHGGDIVTHIRLPKSHWAYLAIEKGFEPWGGGDEAPGDWTGDKNDVMYRDGRMTDSRHPNTWHHLGVLCDIIGYRKKPAPVEAAMPADWAIDRAIERLGVPGWEWTCREVKERCDEPVPQIFMNGARYIEQHEEPPVDPLVEAVNETSYNKGCPQNEGWVDALRAALASRGLEIVEKKP